MSAPTTRGCDWLVPPRAERCDRSDLALDGDGDHVCTIHVAAYFEARRVVDEAFSRDYVTPSADHYAEQDAKTCQPECDCGCHGRSGEACMECGGPVEARRLEVIQ